MSSHDAALIQYPAMPTAVKEAKPRARAQDAEIFDPAEWLPPEIGRITDQQTDLPRLAKDAKAVAAIESRLSQIPTSQNLHDCDVRQIDILKPNNFPPASSAGINRGYHARRASAELVYDWGARFGSS